MKSINNKSKFKVWEKQDKNKTQIKTNDATRLVENYKDCTTQCDSQSRIKLGRQRDNKELLSDKINCVKREPSCNALYNKSRVPSYCDRVIYEHSKNIKVQNIRYESKYVEKIATTDHAITYFCATLDISGKKLKILYITFNQGGNQYPAATIIDIIDKSIQASKLTGSESKDNSYRNITNFDVIIICQQETGRNDTLYKDLQNELNMKNNYSFNTYKGLPINNFYVRLSIFVKKEFFNLSVNAKPSLIKSECINIACTKSYVGIVLDLNISKFEIVRLNVFGCHLPISFSPKDLGLGYGERIRALIEILKTIKEIINKPMTAGKYPDHHFSIIGGDLNFRIELDHNIDQLQLAMNIDKNKSLQNYFRSIVGVNYEKQVDYFKGWIEENINFIPTCKLNNI